MKFLIPFFVILFAQNIQAQIPAPDLKCVRRDTLIWDLPNVSCGTATAYEIYASRNPNGPFQLLTSITNLAQTRYFHNNIEGGIYFYYMQTAANCAGALPNTSDTLDNQPPQLTPVSTVNVVDNKTVEVRWRRNPAPEVVGYIVYKKTATGLVRVADINNRDSLRYVDNSATPSVNNEEYQVLAIDACGNTSLFDANHRTILAKIRQSTCAQTITVSWDLYQNWSPAISKHEVWLSINGKNPILYTSVGAKDTSFVFKDVKDKVRYSFYIRAVQLLTGVTAKSNEVAIVADILQPVSELVLENLSVNKKNTVDLIWRWNTDAKIDSVRIYRAETDSSTYTRIGGFKPVSPIDFNGTFTDATVNAATKSYFYIIETKDQCGAVKRSNVGNTIHLTGVAEQNRQNRLRWNALKLPGVEMIGYELERTVNDLSSIVPNPISKTATEATDIAKGDEPRVCYRITAIYNNILSDSTRIETRAQSNIACVEQSSSFAVPNAFTPGGNNPEFKPVILFSENVKSYQMLIFDRWGSKIYESTTPSVGWDGKRNGSDLPQGVYTYIIRLERSAGGTVENKGVVLLLR